MPKTPKTTKKETRINPNVKSIIALLNNINDLIVVSNKRKEASDVMKALKIYANNVNYPIPEDKISNFHAVLLDSRPITLSYILREISMDVLAKAK